MRYREIAYQWGRIGVIGFGGPPAHIKLFRELCVEKNQWSTAEEFEDAIAAVNLLPGPASTQLAIYLAWKQKGTFGAILGGLMFIAPGLVVTLLLAHFFLADSPPKWILGAALGAGAVIPAVALSAGLGLLTTSRQRAANQWRWGFYLILGTVSVIFIGSAVALVLILCGLVELVSRRYQKVETILSVGFSPKVLAVAVGFATPLTWVAVKVGALSYGGGFVIIPLMQADAVTKYHWMSASQFLSAVAIGQITPGPVVLTVAVVGFAVAGLLGALWATLVAFTPSFLIVIAAGSRFKDLLRNESARAFITGAGPAAIGSILGSSFLLGQALVHRWQFGLLAIAVLALLIFKRSTILVLVISGLVGSLLFGLSLI
jgi:chromate transporter